jgi:hypothetical protein
LLRETRNAANLWSGHFNNAAIDLITVNIFVTIIGIRYLIPFPDISSQNVLVETPMPAGPVGLVGQDQENSYLLL